MCPNLPTQMGNFLTTIADFEGWAVLGSGGGSLFVPSSFPQGFVAAGAAKRRPQGPTLDPFGAKLHPSGKKGNSKVDFAVKLSGQGDESRLHTMTNTEGVTTTSKRRLRQPNLQPTYSKKKIIMLPNAPKYACYSYAPGSAHVAAGLSEPADPDRARRAGEQK